MWLTSGAIALAGAALPAARWWRGSEASFREGPYGRIQPDEEGVLDLLEGFSYRVLQRAGTSMTDGYRMPGRPDGMACFDGPDETLVLMRNHELPPRSFARLMSYGSQPADEAYSQDGWGGVTRLVLDATDARPRSSNLVLAGTSMNCSGGASPWGWLSCEEDVSSPHGFVFACDPAADRVQPATRLDSLGRFRHEAAAVDPDRTIVYLSEDRPDSCFYRFIPDDPATPVEGRLQVLRIHGRRTEDTTPLTSGVEREVEWLDLPHPTPEQDDLRYTAQRAGAAIFCRGEGVSFGDGAVFVCATSGGPIGGGQIFRLDDEGDGGTLRVLVASTDRDRLDMPDNIAVAPSGMPFFVEDGPGRDWLRGITSSGEVFDFGRKAAGDGELTGLCFSPSGDRMFLNLQEEGLTMVIEGPFDRLA